LGELAARGFVVGSDRALAGIVTCAGLAGCRSGLADTKSDALALGNLLDARKVAVFGLHLTGCGKSCAAPRPAPVTLLGVSPGHYDVFLRSDAEAAGFGKLVGRDLTIEQAGALLADKFSLVPE
jgi:precorrin-3B synthase